MRQAFTVSLFLTQKKDPKFNYFLKNKEIIKNLIRKFIIFK